MREANRNRCAPFTTPCRQLIGQRVTELRRMPRNREVAATVGHLLFMSILLVCRGLAAHLVGERERERVRGEGLWNYPQAVGPLFR